MYPILEHDISKKAVINPEDIYDKIPGVKYCVISFFKNAVDNIVKKYNGQIITTLKSEMGNHHIYQINYKDTKVGLYLSGVGAALSAGLFEEVIAHGFSKFIACGGAGTLYSEIKKHDIIIPTSAVRDEGVSYHYLKPSEEVNADKTVINTIEKTLNNKGIDYIKAKTWTTDAFYRETHKIIEKRKKQGCKTVEMETASFMAVAKFRDVDFGQILYSGDDVSGIKWDSRDWKSNTTARENLLVLALDICINL